MPKLLSLKKAGNEVKSQKSITHFFRNSNPPSNSLINANGIKSSPPKASSKRKAQSPIQEDDATSKTVLQKPNENVSKKHKKVENITPQENFMNTENTVKVYKIEDMERKPLSPIKSSKENAMLENHGSQMKNVEETLHKKNAADNKLLNHDDDIENMLNDYGCEKKSIKMSLTPKKSPASSQELRRSPRIAKLSQTPEKKGSPHKRKSPVKALDFGDDVEDMFNDEDEWELNNIEECLEDLDLTTMQRCEVSSVVQHDTSTEVKLRNDENKSATCYIQGVWRNPPLVPNEKVSVIASRVENKYVVDNSSGLIVLRPDHLMSTTSVVAGVFCRRKAVLQERFKGIDSANDAMTMGILIHELVQKALLDKVTTANKLRTEADCIIKQSTHMLYDAGLTVEQTKSNMEMYIQPLAEFMQVYIADGQNCGASNVKKKWLGTIDKVLDIEENVCCPQLGLKGKIDATLQVTIHDRKGPIRQVIPLELKSGRASQSAEHRGQLVLYGMMGRALDKGLPTDGGQAALLLYLKEKVSLHEVKCGHPEKRDLIMLRNDLVQYLADGPDAIDPESIPDIEEASRRLSMVLPEPVHHENACRKCPYLTLCSIHMWHTNGPKVSESHPLSKLKDEALAHLSEDHIAYLIRWTALLRIEEKGQSVTSPLHALWTERPEVRENRGVCAANLSLKSVAPSGDRFMHVFEKESNKSGITEANKPNKGPQEGDFSIVSVDNRPWIAAGVVSLVRNNQIHILLERDVSRRRSPQTKYSIDNYESYASTVQNLTNLGALMEDTDRAHSLRQVIIDKQAPEFDKKLPREVGRIGTKLMKSLNIEQQRAVLKAMSAKRYSLLRGLPGTGKTQTLCVLVQMLCALGRRVLVTAHTHSAVDTLLSRLPSNLRILRLGSSSRVNPSLQSRCERHLADKCDTPEKLAQLYDSMEVVGVTCLGANHALLARTTFDVCIVDEATQVLQSTVIRPLLSAREFVLVGDPLQLPPVVRSKAARRLGMEESLFHRLLSAESCSTLSLQYRMNAALTELANSVAYNGALKCASTDVSRAVIKINVEKLNQFSNDKTQWLQKACSPEITDAAIFVDTSDKPAQNKTRSCANADEACVVLMLIEALIQGGLKPSDIGVIAPYREQVALLRCAVSRNDVTGTDVSTVDQFQGRDKSVIIYSCTRSWEGHDEKVKEGEVLNDQRRLAVSVTRAKHKLLLVGDPRALRRYAPLQKVIENCKPIKLAAKELEYMVDKYASIVS